MIGSATEDLSKASASCRTVVAGISDGQWSLPTPCTEWDLSQLTAHVVRGNQMFAAILQGDRFPASSGGARADVGRLDGVVAAYDAAANDLIAAFSGEGVLDRIVTVPFGAVPGSVALHLRLTELLVHGWDVARATGQDIDVPEALVAAQELAFARRAMGQLPAGRSPFGPAQPVAADAGTLEQLVALLGRKP